MPRFKIGDPVVVVTDQEWYGQVRFVDFEHVDPLMFTPQNFRGQKGWIDYYGPLIGRTRYGEERGFYGVLFSLQGNPRTVSVRRFIGGDCGWPVATQQRVESGLGRLHFNADEFVHDSEPEGDYGDVRYPALDHLDRAMRVLQAASWLLKAREATLAPELYVAGLRKYNPQISGEEIQKFLEEVIKAWHHFQETYYPSVQEYIRKKIGFDWAHVLRAVEQAERGDSTAFTDLIRRVRVEPSILLRPLRPREDPTIAVSEPLKVRWK